MELKHPKLIAFSRIMIPREKIGPNYCHFNYGPSKELSLIIGLRGVVDPHTPTSPIPK